MNKEKFDGDQIRTARQTDLAEFLLSIGEPLRPEGSRHVHREYDSLVFTENAYFWNSRDEHGNAIDYLVRHLNMNFNEAVGALLTFRLLGSGIKKPEPEKKQTSFDWSEIKLSADMRRTVAYLTKSRGINPKIIQDLIKNRLLYQEAESNNAIFPIYDELGEIVGAEQIGTLTNKRFKGVKTGSKYGYGYSVPQTREPKYILFFESAVDLLSFIDIEQMKGKDISQSNLISLGGLKENIIKSTLERQNSPCQPILCVDNDQPAKEFITAVRGKIEGVRTFLPSPDFKDWNDQLKAMKAENEK